MKTRQVFAGIYKDKGLSNEDAEFMINYNGSMCLIFDGIGDIMEDVEHAGDFSRYELVEGYSLGVKQSKNTNECVWEIRNSGIKHSKDYIIKSGTFKGPRFIASLKPFYKAMSM